MNGRKGQMKKLDLIALPILGVLLGLLIGLHIGSYVEKLIFKERGYFPIEILQRTNAYYSSEIEKIREACFNQLQERR